MKNNCSKYLGVVTSAGASDEHPMSTRSASDGRRWHSRGMHVICTLVLLFTFAIGNVLAADYTIYQATSSGVNTANKTETGISVTFNSFKAVSNSPVTTVADATYGIEAGLKAPRWGGGGDGKNIKVTVSDNYTATITVYVQTSAADKTVSIKSGSESGTEIASVNCAAIGTVYRVQASDLAAGDYYIKAGNDKVGLIKLVATVTATGGGDTEAPTLSSSVPANSATNVAVEGTIVLTFSEALASVDASKFTLTGATIGTVAIDGTDAKKVNVPYSGAENESTVTLAVAAEAVADAAGNKSAELSNISFTTVAAAPVPDVVLNNNGTLNSTDFVTLVSELDGDDYSVSSVAYTNNFKFGNTCSSIVNQSWSNKYLAYDVKTTSATLKLYVYNKNSNSKNLYYQVLSETGNGDFKTESITSKGNGKIIEIPVTATKGTRVVFGANHTDVRICQLEVYENGTTLTKAGEVGYELALKGRPFATGSSNLFSGNIDGMEYVLYSELKLVNNNAYSVMRNNDGTHYFKIPATNDVQLKVTTDNSAKFYVLGSAVAGDPDKDVQYGGEAGTFNVNLPHKDGYWYIIPVVAATGTGNEVRISKIAFATLPAGKHVTYSAGDGSVKEGKSLPTHADAWEGDKITLASGDNLERSGYDFSGWKANGTGDLLKVGDKYTMTNDDVQFVAQWTEHIAKYGVKFMDGTTKLDSLSVTLGEAPVFANPTKALYSFAGWKDGENNDVTLSDLATSVTVEDTKLVLYAQWAKAYAADGTVNFADDNNSGVLADFLPAGYACGDLDGSKNSVWGKENEGDAFFGYKLRHSGAYVELRVVANKRVTFTFGNYAQAGTIKVGDAEAATCTLTDSKYVVDTDAEAVIRFTTTSDGTVTLKSIIIGEIPAVSDDATLSDLTLKYGEEAAATITGFNPGKYIYNVVMPYGTTKAELPIVGATATQGAKSLVTINQAKDREDWKTVIRVQAEDRVNEHDKYYEVRFIVEPKQGVSLIKATTQKVVTGYIGGTAVLTKDGSAQSGNTYKLDSKVTFGITLADSKTFKEGDVFVMNITVAPGSATSMGTMKVYDAADATEPIYETAEVGSVGVNYWTLPAAAEGKTSLYIKRGNGDDWNPTFSYVEVRRLMAPVIKSFKIGEAEGVISGTNIAVEVPYGTAVNALTPEIEYYGNGIGAIDKTGPQDFTNPVEYTVSSAYAEDATGDYAPVTYTVTVNVADHYEAKIGTTGYATLVEAVAAAVDGDVIVLQENVTAGAGVMIAKADAKQITIDFGGFTYKAVSPGVGSVGTQNQAFHFEKGCDITLKNGTITSEGNAILMLVQNYGDLTLENITLDGSGLEGSHRYVISNNCGDVVIGDGATITAKTGDVAFDICATNYYPEGVTVTVKDGATINGIVEYDVWGTKPTDNKAELAIEGGTLNITWNVESALAEDAKSNLNVSGGVFNAAVPEDYCAEGYAPYQIAAGKYGVQPEGVIRAAAADAGIVWTCNLDNGVVIYSSESDGRLKDATMTSTSSDVTACGGAEGGYNVNQSKFLLKFPVNVKEFTLYAANNTARTFNNIYVNDEASADIKISTVGDELTGTYTYTKDGKCQTMTAVFDDENIIPANYYVLVVLSGANIYRVLYTEAECTTPTVTVADQTAKDGVAVTLTAEASALGATYQWYTCDDELGTNPVSIPGKTAKTLSVTKSGADDQFYKVVVGCNCSEEKAEAVAKVSLYTAVTTLVDVTENTVWDWTLVTKDIDGQDITSDGKKVNGANGILANYIQGAKMDKIESNNGAYAIRSNSNQYYQGASLHMHTTKAGMLKIHARNDGNPMTLNVQNAGRDIELGSLGNWKDYTIYVQAGDVVIYNVPEATGKPMRIDHMTFTVKESPDYTRDKMLGAGVYGTICVPYNVPAGGIHGITVYELMGRESQYGKLAFDEIIEMEAGVPYVFQAHGDELALFYGETSVANPVDKENGMYGTFTDQVLTELNDVYYFAQKALWGCADLASLNVPANRAYVKLSEVGSVASSVPAPGRRRISMAVNGEQVATGIENTGFESEAPRKVLINGELYIIRGEKMYDAKGQLIK